MNKWKIFLADDHGILREGVKMILSASNHCEVVGEADDGKAALDQIEKIVPDIAILDISMPSMTGIEVARHLKKSQPSIKIIMLSRHDNEEYVKQLLKFNINGFVLKEEAGDDLLKCIESVMNGKTYLSPRIESQLSGDSSSSKDSPFISLTNREREILKLIAEGKSSEEIAKILNISSRTVKVHRANMMKKLNVHKVADMVKYAIKAGMVET
ncbi:MAG: response regulator transcription factor [Spirochaetia bacterium]|nr:response regulator transcription factor [Spirochaetia bacterium]